MDATRIEISNNEAELLIDVADAKRLIQSLQAEVVRLTMDNCREIKIAVYDGLGRPDVVDGKCNGYAGHMDEPHHKCQECKVGVWEGAE